MNSGINFAPGRIVSPINLGPRSQRVTVSVKYFNPNLIPSKPSIETSMVGTFSEKRLALTMLANLKNCYSPETFINQMLLFIEVMDSVGVLIPQRLFVYGSTNISQERYCSEITSDRFQLACSAELNGGVAILATDVYYGDFSLKPNSELCLGLLIRAFQQSAARWSAPEKPQEIFLLNNIK